MTKTKTRKKWHENLISIVYNTRNPAKGGSHFGHNLAKMYAHARKTNDTQRVALIRELTHQLASAGITNFGGEIRVHLGTRTRGNYLSPDQNKKRKKIGRVAASGQNAAEIYPTSLTLYRTDDTKAAGYTLDTRLLGHELRLGRINAQWCAAALPILHEPGAYRYLKRAPSEKREREHVARQNKTLEDLLKQMPEGLKAFAREHSVDLGAIGDIFVLEAGTHLKDGKWSALLYALDPGKNRNDYNWFAEQEALSGDVFAAYATLTQLARILPNDKYRLIPVENIILLRAYQMQVRRQPREGITEGIDKELAWLSASTKDAIAARGAYRKFYGKPLDLSQQHEPARIYAGELPPHEKAFQNQKMSIEQKLEDPYWTVADREGILRKIPLVQFREYWNREILDEYFGSENFLNAMRDLYKIKQEDAARIAAAGGPRNAELALGNHYKLVAGIFDRMHPDNHDSDDFTALSREYLLRRTLIHKAEEEFETLYTLAQQARRAKETTQNARTS